MISKNLQRQTLFEYKFKQALRSNEIHAPIGALFVTLTLTFDPPNL